MKAALATVAGLVVAAAVVLGGWQAGWWFRGQNVNREYQVNTHSQGYVQAQVDHARNLAVGYDASNDPGQKAVLKGQFCAIYLDLGQQPPADLVTAAAHVGC